MFLFTFFFRYSGSKVSFDEGAPNVSGVTPAGQHWMKGLAGPHFFRRKQPMAWLVALQTVELADVARSV